MPKRLSMKDLAQRAGVSPATVSMALRDHPRISAATRARIQALAAELGYRPDPALRALADYRDRERRGGYAVLALVVDSGEPYMRTRRQLLLTAGIDAAAQHLGYHIHPIDVARLSGPEEVARSMEVRNVRGAIVMAAWLRNAGVHLDLARRVHVSIGYPPQDLPIDCVTTDDFADTQAAYRELSRRGYRRIGMLIHPSTDQHSRGRWGGGYRAAAGADALICTQQHRPEAIAAWLERYDLDAVITRKALREGLRDGLARTGRRLGADLAVAKLGAKQADGEMAGILDDYRAIGARAVQHLDARLRSFARDAGPSIALLVPGRWVDGASAPERLGRASTGGDGRYRADASPS